MVAVMGPPPSSILQSGSDKIEHFWDQDGRWKGVVPIPELSLETEERWHDGEDKQKFICLLRKMLQWDPMVRHSIDDIFADEWLSADEVESDEGVKTE